VSRIARRGALLLLAAAVAGTACGGARPGGAGPGTAAGGRPVLVLGDSLTLGGVLEGELHTTLVGDGWQPDVVADIGKGLDWGLDEVRSRESVPPVVVVGLGTNPGTSPETFAFDVPAMVQELTARGADIVVWWPPAAGGDAQQAARAERAVAVRSTAGGPLVVPDWPAALAAHPDWLSADGIHLTPDGYHGLAAFLRAQLDAATAGVPPPARDAAEATAAGPAGAVSPGSPAGAGEVGA
jgi:lysophospholipase L1-like esterase